MIPLFKHILHSLVQSTFPTHLHGRKRVLFDDVFKYVMYILRTGCQWRSLVTSNVSWQTVHRHFCIWSRKGLIEQAYYKLVSIYLQRIGIQQRHIITDTSFIKNINGIDCVGPSSVDRGRKATKISIITDELSIWRGAAVFLTGSCVAPDPPDPPHLLPGSPRRRRGKETRSRRGCRGLVAPTPPEVGGWGGGGLRVSASVTFIISKHPTTQFY